MKRRPVLSPEVSRNLTQGTSLQGVAEFEIKNGWIEHLTVVAPELTGCSLRRLGDEDCDALYSFYTAGLSPTSRVLFPPYPLFKPWPVSADELWGRLQQWRAESDWTVMCLWIEETIRGVGLLKRLSASPTTGLSTDETVRGRGFGTLIQRVLMWQALLQGVALLRVTVAPENSASMALHRRCGYLDTGRTVPHTLQLPSGEAVTRDDVEMEVRLEECDWLDPFRSSAMSQPSQERQHR
jgi:RimJ/RimL family protein N-acetyltransferase